MNYYPFHIGDYASATRHLSWEEDCAYRRLLDVYYTSEKPIPLDERQACRLILAATDAQREAVRVVLGEFFEQTDSGWINRRADQEIARMAGKREKARESAMAGVQARQGKSPNAAKLRSERMAAARSKATHTQEQWRQMLESCGHKCVKCGATGVPLDKDHIEPIYQGGSDGIENLQPLCAPCNAGKGPDATDHRPASVRAAFANRDVANAYLLLADGELPTPTPTPTPTPIKKKGPSFVLPDWVPVEAWKGYEEMRQRMKKPMTDRARNLMVGELAKLKEQGNDPAAVLDRSVTKGWTSVYPVPEDAPPSNVRRLVL